LSNRIYFGSVRPASEEWIEVKPVDEGAVGTTLVVSDRWISTTSDSQGGGSGMTAAVLNINVGIPSDRVSTNTALYKNRAKIILKNVTVETGITRSDETAIHLLLRLRERNNQGPAAVMRGVGTNAIRYVTDRFASWGYIVPYKSALSGGVITNKPLVALSTVMFEWGKNAPEGTEIGTFYKDGVAVQAPDDQKAFISKGTTMVSLRVLSILFGLEDSEVQWITASEPHHAQIDARRSIGKVIRVVPNLSYATVMQDGVEIMVPLRDAQGNEVFPTVHNDRIFVPLRAIGTIYGTNLVFAGVNEAGEEFDSADNSFVDNYDDIVKFRAYLNKAVASQ